MAAKSLLLCSLWLLVGVMGAAGSESRACIDDSDCVDLGYKFACFLYKCYNWQEPGAEHPHCRSDKECKGKDMQCYRHWNLRMVNKGLCFSSHSLKQCQGHSSCRDGEKCCGSHCCPLEYFQQWRNFTCLSDLQCTTLHTGDACCEGNRCCWREEANLKEIVEEKLEKVEKDEDEEPLDVAQPHQEEEEEEVDPVLITDVELEENKFLEEDFSESTTINISDYTENDTTSADITSETELYAAMNNATELLMHDDERNNENDKSHDYVYNTDSDTDLVATDTSDNINFIFQPFDDNNIETVANETSIGDTEAAKEESSSEKSTNNKAPSIDESPIVHLWNVSYKEPFHTWNTSLEESHPTSETSPSINSSKEESSQPEESSINMPPILHLWNISHLESKWDQHKKDSPTPVESNEINSVGNYIDKNITTTEEIFVIRSDEIDKDDGQSQEKEVSLTMSRLPPRTLQTSAPSLDNDRGEPTDSTVPKDILKYIVKQNVRAGEELVKLNVGGEMFETFRSTLGKVDNTILDKAVIEETSGVYHVDACPKAFQVILGWIRYGKGFNVENIPDEHLENVANSLGINEKIHVLHV